jgi:ABC-type Zn2+ transport system substrate-binding protein/surface adhesin
MGLDPEGNKVDHILAVSAATTDPIHQSPLESNFEGGLEVYMVGNGEELLDKTIEEIHQESAIELARAARLARDAERGKRHNGMQDDSGESEDKPGDGAATRRHHLNFNSRHLGDRDRL